MDKQALWLLVYYRRPDVNNTAQDKSLMASRGDYVREYGYSDLCKGNLVLAESNAFIRYLGSISDRQLCNVCCDIFSSHEAWKLNRLRVERSTGVGFWINLNPIVYDPISGDHRSFSRSN